MASRGVGIVGLGRMGLTLAAGFCRSVGSGRLFAAGRSERSIARLRDTVPDATLVPLTELPNRADVIVLCVRNADLAAVLDELRPQLAGHHIVLTLNNGLPLHLLSEAVPGQVAKLIPSVGNEIGAGATLLMPGPRLTEHATEHLLEMLRGFSHPFLIREQQGRAATDLASCGAALLASVAQSMIAAQSERGATLPIELAEQLVVQSVHAVSQLLEHGSSLDEIVARVAVPGGNTAAAIQASRHDLSAAWRAAFQATADNEASKPIPPILAHSEAE
ncbi:pyrroline-5-carboxylate reductase family protein [Nonomuraea sp. 10N515B]|uniref:pyrroline-5-carboxylate reductase family protein n=1 Tax=Nonomuraea sp. 10N515B TaxID=3457422 RepID=UPI003FCC4B08